MAIEDNPISRKKYGEELKRRREELGLTQEELSEVTIISRTHIAHMEAGRRRPCLEDARRLDQALGGGHFFEEFLPTLDGRTVAEHFKEALEFEGQATIIREYAPKLVPGLLQTEEYAREVLNSGSAPKTDEERDRLLATRLSRARILDNFNSPLFWAMLDESVIRRPIGGPGVMCRQLRHIVALADSRRIRVHVLPFSVGFHSLMEGLVKLMWFEDLPPIAYTEGLKSGRVWEVPSTVGECQLAYDHALGDALSHRESLALLRSVAEDYEHEALQADHP
ncbi:helix-turn-helix transcriptional regulator [Streptomyces sp. NBC_00237]|uniref:helix-turn-helix domain-containing protein n=1 Tax=Streptomyces sp. NBC_00237 TaxID=2975687 RepID=UPI00225C16D8|nr:helix-turn-helix transcriptional regulator [Streptomyces sp. NBC_00237]MCX5200697.1 helix-turn-helix transcriptional regulator [Streptomyces sp. NBC_00237]